MAPFPVIPNPVAHWHAVSGLQRIGANGGEGSAFSFSRHSPARRGGPLATRLPAAPE